ncbi:MAG: hypothetical protein WBB07_17625 [Mycobacterium sp.]
MTAPLKPDTAAVNAEVFLRAWLLPIVTTTPPAAAIGSKMWATTLPKPYRTVRRITGPQTDYSDEPVMHVHTFDIDYSKAATAAMATDDRMRVLMEHPGWNTTLSDGQIVHCDWVDIIAAAHEESYGAESVVTRFVSEYRLGLSFT